MIIRVVVSLVFCCLIFSSQAQKKEVVEGFLPILSAVKVNSETAKGEIQNNSSSYIDDHLSFTWTYIKKEDEFSLTVKNNGTKSVKILWQESGFVSPSSSIERIFYGGMKYFGRYSEQMPTRLYANTMINNKIEVFTYSDDNLRKLPIYDTEQTSVFAKMEELKEKADKTKFRFILVIIDGKNEFEYDFHFSTVLKIKGK